MTLAPVTFSDAELAFHGLITSLLAGRPESYFAGVTVGTSFPTSGDPRHVQIGWDGSPVSSLVNERATVRVTCWRGKGKRAEVKAMAGILHGMLLRRTHGGDGLRSILPGTGRLVDTDRETGLDFCTFTVRAELAATPIT